MKYIANPVTADAFKIVEVGAREFAGRIVKVDDGSERLVTPEQMARYEPIIGDYFVIQADGYIYINPKDVFERKYSAVREEQSEEGVLRPGNPYFGHVFPADKPVVPGLEQFELVYAKDQPEYIPLRTLVSNDEKVEVVSRWSPNAEQRRGIALGADIFLTLLTFRDKEGKPNRLQPIRMFVADNPNPEFFKQTLYLEAQGLRGAAHVPTPNPNKSLDQR